MSAQDNGGPAFPGNDLSDAICNASYNGMTLRDWFAGQALIGAVTTTTGLGRVSREERASTLMLMSQVSYEIADYMLAARKEAAK